MFRSLFLGGGGSNIVAQLWREQLELFKISFEILKFFEIFFQLKNT